MSVKACHEKAGAESNSNRRVLFRLLTISVSIIALSGWRRSGYSSRALPRLSSGSLRSTPGCAGPLTEPVPVCRRSNTSPVCAGVPCLDLQESEEARCSYCVD